MLLLAGGVVTIPVLGIKLWELFGLWTGPVVLVSGLVLLLIGGMVNQPEVEY